MKKGFTLVELAIVLVVIGLLMGMAFKGKSLVDAARIKADVNKVQKLSTAINVYYSKYDTLPGMSRVTSGGITYNDNSSGAIYQTLINEGLVKESDFKSSSGATYWAFSGCNHTANTWSVAAISETSNLCIYRSKNEPDDTKFQSSQTTLQDPWISGVSICQLETLLDDKDLTTGDGRTAGALDTKIGAGVATTWNCADTTTAGYDINATARPYLMRIF